MNWYMRNHPVPKYMPKKETRLLIMELKEILAVATMEEAFFTDPATTKYIRDTTNVWRETWIIKPLKELIKRYET